MSQDEEFILADLFRPMNLKSGEYFLEEGQLCRYVGFIESGLLRYHMNDNGVQKTLYFNKEGEFVSNYQSFLPREPSNTSIQAIEDTTLQVISYDNLQKLYSAIREGEKLGRLAIESVFLTSMQQLKSFYKDSPAGTIPAVPSILPQPGGADSAIPYRFLRGDQAPVTVEDPKAAGDSKIIYTPRIS